MPSIASPLDLMMCVKGYVQPIGTSVPWIKITFLSNCKMIINRS